MRVIVWAMGSMAAILLTAIVTDMAEAEILGAAMSVGISVVLWEIIAP